MRRALIAVAVLGLLAAAPARGAYDPVGGGVTTLSLDRGFLRFLAADHISLDAASPASRSSRSLSLPDSGGQFDPTTGRGEIETEGVIGLRNARKRVPIRKLVVKTARAPLVAKVGGSQLKLATSTAIGSRRRGFDAIFSARKLKLTAKVAMRLNKKLRPRRQFVPGQLIGTMTTAVEPLVTSILPTGRAALVFDAAFVAKLEQHFVSLNPIFPAEHVGPTFTLPIIAEGALAPDAAAGTLRTGGEIEFLQLGAGQVFWHELWFDLEQHTTLAEVDVEPTPAFPGKLGQVPMLALGGGAASSEPAARTIALSGASLTLPQSTADVFNRAFAEGKDDFKAGELLGTLSFVAQGQ